MEADKSHFIQIVSTGVLHVDLNAGYVAEQAHRNVLLYERVIGHDTLIMPGEVFPRSFVLGDVYIDGLVILSVFHFSKQGLKLDVLLAHIADKSYAKHSLPVDGETECAQFCDCDI